MHLTYKAFQLGRPEINIFLSLNPYLPEFSDPPLPKNVRSHSSNAIENATPL